MQAAVGYNDEMSCLSMKFEKNLLQNLKVHLFSCTRSALLSRCVQLSNAQSYISCLEESQQRFVSRCCLTVFV
jgi:hypothetical protein